MPNWCQNDLHVRADMTLISQLAQAMKNGNFFDSIVPMPLSMKVTVKGSLGDENRQKLNLERTNRNSEVYGFPDWYDYAVSKWGTKWELLANEEFEIFDEDGEVWSLDNFIEEARKFNSAHKNKQFTFSTRFDTAWAPPFGIYNELSSIPGVEVEAYYYEPGMGFVGEFTSEGGELDYSIPDTADEVTATIPAHLDEMFAIAESMEMWEDDEDFDSPTP
jgi:hypothetical protein